MPNSPNKVEISVFTAGFPTQARLLLTGKQNGYCNTTIYYAIILAIIRIFQDSIHSKIQFSCSRETNIDDIDIV